MSATLVMAGEALAVFLADGADLANSRLFERIVSGAEVNVAAGFVAAGHRARVVSRVGADALGRAVARTLMEWGVDAHLIVDPSRPTGVLVRTVGGVDRGEVMQLRRGAAIEALDERDVDDGWVDPVDAVFISGTTAVRSSSAGRAIAHLVERACRAGALVVVDPNLRPSLGSDADFVRALEGLRGRIDVALGDRHELAILAGSLEGDAIETLHRQGVRLVVEKRGPEGVTAYEAGASWSSPALVNAADVVDTVGAGDAFAAALLAALLEGSTVPQALERASGAAARVVRVRGDVPEPDHDGGER